MARDRAGRRRSAVPIPARTTSNRVGAILAGVAVLYGVAAAISRAWTCDDAFISFRYADNLVHGLGLVFNAGERVEGYSNFLWTLWCAAGIRWGWNPERWAVAWGIACYGLSLALLGYMALRSRRRFGSAAPLVPAAALLGCVHADWSIFASGGLETSLFTLMVLAAFLLLTGGRGWIASSWAGLLLGAACLTRPEGPLFAATAAGFILLVRRPRRPHIAGFALACAAVYVPFLAWRVAYYGDWLPNTWYAKSIGRAWFTQGWFYLRLYLDRYWVLLAAIPLAISSAFAIRGARNLDAMQQRDWLERAGLAAAFATLSTLAVVDIGGDFMFARLLIPATPFYLILFELGLYGRGSGRWTSIVPTIAAMAALLLAPAPMRGTDRVRGVSNEWEVYSPELRARTQSMGEALRRYFADLPLCVVFMGGQARTVYYARPAIAIEGETGLTDRTIARQPLGVRGRVGHEKRASPGYLLSRGVNLALSPLVASTLHLSDHAPTAEIHFDSVTCTLIGSNPPIVEALKSRGARFAPRDSLDRESVR